MSQCVLFTAVRTGGNALSARRSGRASARTGRAVPGAVLAAERGQGADLAVRCVGGAVLTFGIVCSTGIAQTVLWAADGRLITVEGGFLIIPKWK